VTILANMLMVHRALAAAGRLHDQGMDAEVIDVRSLAPLDMEPIIASVQKTGRVVIVEEDNLTCGWGAEVAAQIYESSLEYLDAPVRRIAAPDTPLPCAALLESYYVPSESKIVDAVLRFR
jgi:pyruvate dehydrogenase E1 component beta subunit